MRLDSRKRTINREFKFRLAVIKRFNWVSVNRSFLLISTFPDPRSNPILAISIFHISSPLSYRYMHMSTEISIIQKREKERT